MPETGFQKFRIAKFVSQIGNIDSTSLLVELKNTSAFIGGNED